MPRYVPEKKDFVVVTFDPRSFMEKRKLAGDAGKYKPEPDHAERPGRRVTPLTEQGAAPANGTDSSINPQAAL